MTTPLFSNDSVEQSVLDTLCECGIPECIAEKIVDHYHRGINESLTLNLIAHVADRYLRRFAVRLAAS